jgi:hypothetical protein
VLGREHRKAEGLQLPPDPQGRGDTNVFRARLILQAAKQLAEVYMNAREGAPPAHLELPRGVLPAEE